MTRDTYLVTREAQGTRRQGKRDTRLKETKEERHKVQRDKAWEA